MEQKTTKTSKGLIVLLAVLIALLAAAAAVWFFFVRDTGYDRYEFDTDAIAGRIQTMSEEEIQAELDRVVEEGMFNISIASAIVFESPTGEGQARIENVAANHYHMQVDIFLDDTGDKVYSSKLIKPGYAIENIKLSKRLKPGVYEATAMFSAVTQQELELFGQAGAQIELYILDDEGRIPQQ